jgi:hypothetical protein
MARRCASFSFKPESLACGSMSKRVAIVYERIENLEFRETRGEKLQNCLKYRFSVRTFMDGDSS